MIFDLHNDILTFGYDKQTLKKEIERVSTNLKGLVLAFWSTKSKNLPFFNYKKNAVYLQLKICIVIIKKMKEKSLRSIPFTARLPGITIIIWRVVR